MKPLRIRHVVLLYKVLAVIKKIPAYFEKPSRLGLFLERR